jgi:hypothetical protein
MCEQAHYNLDQLGDYYLIDVAKGVENERAKYLKKYELVNIYDDNYYDQDSLSYYDSQ